MHNCRGSLTKRRQFLYEALSSNRFRRKRPALHLSNSVSCWSSSVRAAHIFDNQARLNTVAAKYGRALRQQLFVFGEIRCLAMEDDSRTTVLVSDSASQPVEFSCAQGGFMSVHVRRAGELVTHMGQHTPSHKIEFRRFHLGDSVECLVPGLEVVFDLE